MPDVPISSFTLFLPANGNASALQTSADLCAQPLNFTAAILGQNGKQVNVNSVVDIAGCGLSIQGVKVKVHNATVTLMRTSLN